MSFLSKICFYAMFGITILLTLYLLFNSLYILYEPYGKKMESLIMAIGGGIMIMGSYYVYNKFYISSQYLSGCGMLGVTWVLCLVVILIGLLYFNGPVRWN